VNIPGYTYLHHDSSTSAGGVATYVSETIRYTIIIDVHMNIDGCENI